MHALYLDDSGAAGNQREEYFVLAGVSLFEAQAEYFAQKLNELAADVNPADPHAVEFHASEIFSGKSWPWNSLSPDDRRTVIKAVLKIFAGSYDTARIFACAVHKRSHPYMGPVGLIFEDLCSRFDRYLSRLRAEGNHQRGMLILDESAAERLLFEEFDPRHNLPGQ